MKLEEVLPALRDGKKIRRKSWKIHWNNLYSGVFEISRRYFYIEDTLTSSHCFNVEDALSDDWEIVE